MDSCEQTQCFFARGGIHRRTRAAPQKLSESIEVAASCIIGKRQNIPQLCCGDEWRVEFEAVVGRFSIQKNSRVPPRSSFSLGTRWLRLHERMRLVFVP